MSKDPKIERYILDRGCSYTYLADLPLIKVNLDASLKNQVRVGTPIRREVADRYEIFLRGGKELPPILVTPMRGGKGKYYRILDGNHRFVAAMQAEHTTIDVYVCEGTPEAIEAVANQANAMNGLPATKEELIGHALHAIRNGMQIAPAALEHGVPEAALRSRLALEQAEDRVRLNGIDLTVWRSLPKQVRGRLGQVATDEGLRELVALVAETGMPLEEVQAAVTMLNERKDGAVQVAKVRKLRETKAEDIAARKALGGKPASPRPALSAGAQRLRMALGQVVSLEVDIKALLVGLSAEAKEGLDEKIDAAVDTLRAIQKELHE